MCGTILKRIISRCFTKIHLRKHCLTRKDVYVCIIWAHSDKLFHGSGHNIGHLAWKPRNLVCDSSVWGHFFKIIAILQFCNFFYKLGHITWPNAKVLHFFDFFRISYAWLKTRSKRRACAVLARSGILQNYDCISD